MQSKISEILKKIDKLKLELQQEYSKLAQKYDFFIKNKKVIFSQKARISQKIFKINLFKYIFTANLRNLLSTPFIYGMIIPWIILDIFLTIYQFSAFPLYWIPRASRKDFFIYDRRFLAYLNILQKINCLYCSYMNWLFAYAVEIAGRTEQYWCPIKHAIWNENEHKYFQFFADYWDAEDFWEKLEKNMCFIKK